MRLEVPDGSIYNWMYVQGLKHVMWNELEFELRMAGRQIRPKDEENYWNGWYNSTLYEHEETWLLKRQAHPSASKSYFDKAWEDYEPHPCDSWPDVSNRFVPCNGLNKPIIPWSEGCMTWADAHAMLGCTFMAENLKGTKTIVIDVDGDHDEKLDGRTIMFFTVKYMDKTHCMSKPKAVCEYPGYESTGIKTPASFHLTFAVDRLVPTMHFPDAHVDIAGNLKNQLRFFKNKEWNGLPPMQMTPEVWEDIKEYLRRRCCK